MMTHRTLIHILALISALSFSTAHLLAGSTNKAWDWAAVLLSVIGLTLQWRELHFKYP